MPLGDRGGRLRPARSKQREAERLRRRQRLGAQQVVELGLREQGRLFGRTELDA